MIFYVKTNWKLFSLLKTKGCCILGVDQISFMNMNISFIYENEYFIYEYIHFI